MVLDENVQMVFLGPFGFRSGRDVNKFGKAAFKIGVTGAPIVTENISTCAIRNISRYHRVIYIVQKNVKKVQKVRDKLIKL
jgi:flavin reductase (DIM6/NTAB) family NADH-FMN oxidoreductase RutF